MGGLGWEAGLEDLEAADLEELDERNESLSADTRTAVS